MIIEVQSLSHFYGKNKVLDNITLSVPKGSMTAVLGGNGSGKTTFLRFLAGYFIPSKGNVSIAGYNSASQSFEMKRHLGYLPECLNFYPEMRVREYLAYRGALKGIPRRRIGEKVLDVLDLCHLRSVENHLIGPLSVGYTQRLGLADALINEPEVLLLDEPFHSLDPFHQDIFSQLLLNLAERHTILLGSHYLTKIESLCSDFFFLHQGVLNHENVFQQLFQKEYSSKIILEIDLGDSSLILDQLHALEFVKQLEIEQDLLRLPVHKKIALHFTSDIQEQIKAGKFSQQELQKLIFQKIKEGGASLLSHSWEEPSLAQKMRIIQQHILLEKEGKEEMMIL